LSDLRFATRLLLKSPVYTVTAVLILAIAIAGNTGAFSAVNVLLLEPLPFRDSERLVVLASAERTTGGRAGVSLPDYQDWTRDVTAFESAGAVSLEQTFTFSENTSSGRAEPTRVSGGRMSATLLPLLGVTPAQGRAILPSDELPGAPPVALLTDRFWDTAFKRDANMVGRDILLDGRHTTVVGVLPPDFRLLYSGYAVWAPLRPDDSLTDRANRSLLGIARLKPGITPAAAYGALSVVTTRLEREYPETNQGWRARVVPIRTFLLSGRGNTLVFIMIALGLMLLVACANVASLQLARGSARYGEIAVRLALGASRRRIVRLLLVEAGIIATVSGGLALALVAGARRVLLASSPELRELTISLPVLGFTIAATAATAIAFGLVPALTATRMELASAIKGNVAAQRTTRRLRSALVVAELSLSLALLVPAGLLFKSFVALRQMDPGFRVRNVLTFSIAVTHQRDAAGGAEAFTRNVVAQLSTIPGVTSASASEALPLEPGPQVNVNGTARATIRPVTPGYLTTFEIPLRAGRGFTNADTATSPPVAIVNETLARTLRPDGRVVGYRVSADRYGTFTIVGVIADVRSVGLRTPPPPDILVPYSQRPRRLASVALATAGDPSQYIAAVRERMRALAPDVPLAYVRSMSEIVAEQTAALRAIALLLGSLAVLAMLLAAAGLSGIMSWLVTQRRHEIGVRTALGAGRRDILALIMRDAVVLVTWGLAIGIPASALIARLVSSFLWGVSTADIAVFVGVPALLIFAALAAGYGPARRAARLDPIAVLRQA
jgi:predicted permease